MKIFRLAEITVQDQAKPLDRNITVNNLQEEKKFINAVNEACTAVNSAIENLEKVAETGDLGIKEIVVEKLSTMLASNKAIIALQNGIIANAADLFQAGGLANANRKIDMTLAAPAPAASTQQGQQPSAIQ